MDAIIKCHRDQSNYPPNVTPYCPNLHRGNKSGLVIINAKSYFSYVSFLLYDLEQLSAVFPTATISYSLVDYSGVTTIYAYTPGRGWVSPVIGVHPDVYPWMAYNSFTYLPILDKSSHLLGTTTQQEQPGVVLSRTKYVPKPRRRRWGKKMNTTSSATVADSPPLEAPELPMDILNYLAADPAVYIKVALASKRFRKTVSNYQIISVDIGPPMGLPNMLSTVPSQIEINRQWIAVLTSRRVSLHKITNASVVVQILAYVGVGSVDTIDKCPAFTEALYRYLVAIPYELQLPTYWDYTDPKVRSALIQVCRDTGFYLAYVLVDWAMNPIADLNHQALIDTYRHDGRWLTPVMYRYAHAYFTDNDKLFYLDYPYPEYTRADSKLCLRLSKDKLINLFLRGNHFIKNISSDVYHYLIASDYFSPAVKACLIGCGKLTRQSKASLVGIHPAIDAVLQSLASGASNVRELLHKKKLLAPPLRLPDHIFGSYTINMLIYGHNYDEASTCINLAVVEINVRRNDAGYLVYSCRGFPTWTTITTGFDTIDYPCYPGSHSYILTFDPRKYLVSKK